MLPGGVPVAKRIGFLASAEECFPSNVVSLEKFRRSRWLLQRVDLLYISDDKVPEGRLQLLKGCAHGLKIVQDEGTLLETVGSFMPDIVLIESGIKWADPIALVASLAQWTSAPLVMLCTRDTRKADRPQMLKRAFAAGLHDTLMLPLRKEEVEETFGVLLKYRSCAPPAPHGF
jgi:CheY-like chemotaxis protein